MTALIRLTDQAVITAARALIMESRRCAARLEDDTLSAEQAGYFGDYMQLLDAALAEIEPLYVERQAGNSHMGSFDALYESASLGTD